MPIRCSRKKVTLIWGLLECIFFSGLINGWFWMQQVLKSEEFFLDVCNTSLIRDLSDLFQKYDTHDVPFPPRSDTSGVTYRRKCVYRRKDNNEIITMLPTTTEVNFMTAVAHKINISEDIFCKEQDERLGLLQSVVIIARNVLALPVGIFLDHYGTTKTRLVSEIKTQAITCSLSLNGKQFLGTNLSELLFEFSLGSSTVQDFSNILKASV
ncbi:hypothetical protein CHS0354_004645 [Potamilus streckersoni]|uniref:Uncharacterized protein n=1 Tax=Potamilus streckersoni TaxID=2493646 RepID=A0AAE0S5M2_9BIVA|nr:hypothetical protein CHS0354_004645 [Potamilus streckersoni]